MFLTTAKAGWDTIQKTYSKMQDAVSLYEIKTKISVTDYYNVINGVWLELDHYDNLKMKCSEDT